MFALHVHAIVHHWRNLWDVEWKCGVLKLIGTDMLFRRCAEASPPILFTIGYALHFDH